MLVTPGRMMMPLRAGGAAAGDGRTLDLQFAADGTLVPRVGPTPAFVNATTTNHWLGVSKAWNAGAANTPRFPYNPATNLPLGLHIISNANNPLDYSRDMTQANWVKSNITAAKDATGLDGVANSCSTLTADAANGTCLQVLVTGNSYHGISLWVKRKTGTGVVEFTDDGGTTWEELEDLSASEFKMYTPLLPLSTKTSNPEFGFRIVTSGDEIEVDFVGADVHGAVGVPTGPGGLIETVTSTVIMGTDQVTITGTDFSDLYNTDEGTIVVEVDFIENLGSSAANSLFHQGVDHDLFAIGDTDSFVTNAIWSSCSAFRAGKLRSRIYAAGVSEWEHYANSTPWQDNAAGQFKVAIGWDKPASTVTKVENGIELDHETAVPNMPTGEDRLRIGRVTTSLNGGYIKQFVYYPTYKGRSEILALGTL